MNLRILPPRSTIFSGLSFLSKNVLYGEQRDQTSGPTGTEVPTNLGIQNDASLLVNPKILLYQLAILLREETICETNEAVGRRHSWAKKTVERFSLLLST